MEIEALLGWAYLEELPKEQRIRDLARRDDGVVPGWRKMDKIASTQTVVDEPNRHGVLPDPHSLEGPHPDALRVSAAVAALAELAIGLPDDWDPFGDLAGEAKFIAGKSAVQAVNHLTMLDRTGVRLLRVPIERLVVKHAILGGAPDWEGGPFTVECRKSRNGRPGWFRRVMVEQHSGQWIEVEQDGYDLKRKRPHPDAYQIKLLDPDPLPVAIERAEYELWHAALAFLAEDLAPALETIMVKPSPRPLRPWETGDLPARNILRDQTPKRIEERAPTRRRRRSAG